MIEETWAKTGATLCYVGALRRVSRAASQFAYILWVQRYETLMMRYYENRPRKRIIYFISCIPMAISIGARQSNMSMEEMRPLIWEICPQESGLHAGIITRCGYDTTISDCGDMNFICTATGHCFIAATGTSRYITAASLFSWFTVSRRLFTFDILLAISYGQALPLASAYVKNAANYFHDEYDSRRHFSCRKKAYRLSSITRRSIKSTGREHTNYSYYTGISMSSLVHRSGDYRWRITIISLRGIS